LAAAIYIHHRHLLLLLSPQAKFTLPSHKRWTKAEAT